MMQKSENKLIGYSISIFAEDKQKIDRMSELTKISRSSIIRLIVHNSLKNIDMTSSVSEILKIINGTSDGKGD